MTFGFPAYYRKIIETGLASQELSRIIVDIAIKLGWTIIAEQDNTIIALIEKSIWSSGEKIAIQINDNGNILIESKCELSTQCIDWGKNKRNVSSFISEYNRYVV